MLPIKKSKDMKTHELLADALSELRAKGYEADFATESFCLYCGDLDMRLNPEEFHIDEAYRFEGDTGPGDDARLYAISSPEGVKGILVDTDGTGAKHLDVDMAKKLYGDQEMLNT
jgi:hypothetical protein